MIRFSAARSSSFSAEIKKLADQLLNQPQLIEVARRNTAAETVAQSAYKVPQEQKRALVEHIVRSRGLKQVLCFVRTKHGASRLARQLEKDGLVASAIHGDKTQAARLEALSRSPLFISAAIPLKIFPPLFNRYGVGQHFGRNIAGMCARGLGVTVLAAEDQA